MKRILVIGCPGAGKSTFARALRDRTGLPLWYLDQIWHRPDRTTISRAEFDARLTGLLRGDAWIIDGNYLRTLELRLRAADTVFLLDYPTGVCLEGARARIGTKREDLPWVEEEFDPEFRQWIEDFRTSFRRSAACWSGMAKGGKCMFSTAGLKRMTGCGHSREYEKRRGNAPLLFYCAI